MKAGEVHTHTIESKHLFTLRVQSTSPLPLHCRFPLSCELSSTSCCCTSCATAGEKFSQPPPPPSSVIQTDRSDGRPSHLTHLTPPPIRPRSRHDPRARGTTRGVRGGPLVVQRRPSLWREKSPSVGSRVVLPRSREGWWKGGTARFARVSFTHEKLPG